MPDTRELLERPMQDLEIEVNLFLLLKKCHIKKIGDLGEIEWSDQNYLKSKGVKIPDTKMRILEESLSGFLGYKVTLKN